ncbi:MAG: hypothetical protein JWN03_848 [Nocardia sp.]|nr:hypothetical protein [Nocardia sp.]
MDRYRSLPLKPLCVNRFAELELARNVRATAELNRGPLLLAITGAAGVGKRVLARTVAYELKVHYGKVAYYSAGEAGTLLVEGPDEIAEKLLVQLGIPWQELPPPPLRCVVLRALIEQHQPLIVLEGIESAGQVLPLLGDLRAAAVVVTGRRPLDALRVAEFVSMPLRGFENDAGVELIRALAGHSAAQVDSSVLARLVSVCGGMPQLLAAAAMRIVDDADSAAQFVTELEETGVIDDLARELSLDEQPVAIAICDAVYGGLAPEDARAYRLLSLLPCAAFDVESAAALLDRTSAMTKRQLRLLVDRSMLRRYDARFVEFPHVMRLHARALHAVVDTAADRRMAEFRIIHWCTERAISLSKSLSDRPILAGITASLFGAIEPRYAGAEAVERASAEFAARWSIFVAALQSALITGRCSDAAALAIALWPFAYQTSRVAELIDALTALVDLPESSDPVAAPGDLMTRWQLLRDLAGLHERIGETDGAMKYLDRAAALGCGPGIASQLEWRALAEEGAGNVDAALVTLGHAWAAVPLMGDPVHEERAYHLIRMHRCRIGVKTAHFDAAEPELTTAESFFRGRGELDACNAALCRALRGDIADHHERYAEAEVLWAEALDVMLRYGKTAESLSLHEKLLQLADRQGRFEDAESHRDALHRLRGTE